MGDLTKVGHIKVTDLALASVHGSSGPIRRVDARPEPLLHYHVDADGSPQTTQTWVDTDGAHVIINTVQTHLKMRNIERDPRVSLAVCDAADSSRTTPSGEMSRISRPRAGRSTLRFSPAVHRGPVPVVRRTGPGSSDPDDHGPQNPLDGSPNWRVDAGLFQPASVRRTGARLTTRRKPVRDERTCHKPLEE